MKKTAIALTTAASVFAGAANADHRLTERAINDTPFESFENPDQRVTCDIPAMGFLSV